MREKNRAFFIFICIKLLNMVILYYRRPPLHLAPMIHENVSWIFLWAKFCYNLFVHVLKCG